MKRFINSMVFSLMLIWSIQPAIAAKENFDRSKPHVSQKSQNVKKDNKGNKTRATDYHSSRSNNSSVKDELNPKVKKLKAKMKLKAKNKNKKKSKYKKPEKR